MCSTYFGLLAEFSTAEIPLRLLSEKYFGLSVDEAGRKARHQSLPVPAYRGGSQKSEWLISAGDLAAHLDKLKEEARRAHGNHDHPEYLSNGS